jgi:hypothetical protein
MAAAALDTPETGGRRRSPPRPAAGQASFAYPQCQELKRGASVGRCRRQAGAAFTNDLSAGPGAASP